MGALVGALVGGLVGATRGPTRGATRGSNLAFTCSVRRPVLLRESADLIQRRGGRVMVRFEG